MTIRCSKHRKQVVLFNNVSELGDVLFLTIWMMEAEFAGQ